MPGTPPHAPFEILIKFKNAAGPAERGALRSRLAAERRQRFRSGAERWKLPPGVAAAQAIAECRGDRSVEYVEPNYIVRTGRVPDDLDEICKQLQDRDSTVGLHFNGPFWQLREWCGFEGLCELMLDDPDLVHDMADFWTEFVSLVMAPVLERLAVDLIGISEDMAYKAHSMISPAMTRRFVLPSYMQWADQLKASGCPVFAVDSDGNIATLLPLWIEAGVNCARPMEVAAGNDTVAYRKLYGCQMAYTGGIDKRAIAAGGDVLRNAVMDIVPPLLEEGGYIPGCDHGVPPDISWSNFIEYTRLLAELTGWL